MNAFVWLRFSQFIIQSKINGVGVINSFINTQYNMSRAPNNLNHIHFIHVIDETFSNIQNIYQTHHVFCIQYRYFRVIIVRLLLCCEIYAFRINNNITIHWNVISESFQNTGGCRLSNSLHSSSYPNIHFSSLPVFVFGFQCDFNWLICLSGFWIVVSFWFAISIFSRLFFITSFELK